MGLFKFSTSRRGFLYETAEDSDIGASDPAWQRSTGLVAVVQWCCYGDDPLVQPPVARLFDLQGRLVRELAPESAKPSAVDYDSSGSHLLYLGEWDFDGRRLHVVEDDGTVRDLPGRYRSADW